MAEKNKGGRPKGSKTTPVRLQKNVLQALPKAVVDDMVNVLYKLATNDAESLGQKSIAPTVMRGAAKDLLDLGINIEKELNKANTSPETEDEEATDGQPVVKVSMKAV